MKIIAFIKHKDNYCKNLELKLGYTFYIYEYDGSKFYLYLCNIASFEFSNVFLRCGRKVVFVTGRGYAFLMIHLSTFKLA